MSRHNHALCCPALAALSSLLRKGKLSDRVMKQKRTVVCGKHLSRGPSDIRLRPSLFKAHNIAKLFSTIPDSLQTYSQVFRTCTHVGSFGVTDQRQRELRVRQRLAHLPYRTWWLEFVYLASVCYNARVEQLEPVYGSTTDLVVQSVACRACAV